MEQGEAVIHFTSSLFISDKQSRKVKPEKVERGHEMELAL